VLLRFFSACASEETALIPSPSGRHSASVRIGRCGRDEPEKLTVWLSNGGQSRTAEPVFIAKKRSNGDDGADLRACVTWTGDSALEVTDPFYLQVTSTRDNVDGVAVTFKRSEDR
jgi:hypothetical protein